MGGDIKNNFMPTNKLFWNVIRIFFFFLALGLDCNEVLNEHVAISIQPRQPYTITLKQPGFYFFYQNLNQFCELSLVESHFVYCGAF